MKRRTFLQGTAAGAAAAAAHSTASAQASPLDMPTNADGTVGSLDPRMLLRVSDPGERCGDMLYRTLGRTGEKVSAIGLGGSHIGKPPVDAKMAVKLIQAALDRGINFLDNSWDYNGGQSEIRMGTALFARRLQEQGVPYDENRWPHENIGAATAGRVAAAHESRSH